MEKPDQVFWNSVKRDPMGNPLFSGCAMYRKDGAICYEFVSRESESGGPSFDEFGGQFAVEDYAKAIDELQKTGKCSLLGSYSARVDMKREGVEDVEMRFHGEKTAVISCKLSQLQLKN